MTEKITVNRRKQRFTQIANSCLQDKRISWKAKGLMAYFMSYPETWIFREFKIISDSTDGRDSIRSGLKELMKYGYLTKKQIKENGRFSYNEYFIDDEIEYTDKSQENGRLTDDGKSNDGKSNGENPPANNNNSSNTYFKNTLSKGKKENEKEEDFKKSKEKKKIDFDFIEFINLMREKLKPTDNFYPTLPLQDGRKLGINTKLRLYDKETLLELSALEAESIYQRAYQNKEIKKWLNDIK